MENSCAAIWKCRNVERIAKLRVRLIPKLEAIARLRYLLTHCRKLSLDGEFHARLAESRSSGRKFALKN